MDKILPSSFSAILLKSNNDSFIFYLNALGSPRFLQATTDLHQAGLYLSLDVETEDSAGPKRKKPKKLARKLFLELRISDGKRGSKPKVFVSGVEWFSVVFQWLIKS